MNQHTPGVYARRAGTHTPHVKIPRRSLAVYGYDPRASERTLLTGPRAWEALPLGPAGDALLHALLTVDWSYTSHDTDTTRGVHGDSASHTN